MLTFEQALEQGAYEAGVEMGVEKGERALLLRLLVRRFGALPVSLASRVRGAPIDEVVRWFDRAVDAASLEDVFASPRPPLGGPPGGQVIDRLAQITLTLDELLAKGTYEKGIQDGMSALVLHQLVHRLGPLPESVTRRVVDASPDELKRWGERVLDAGSLDDVFAAP